MICVLTFREVGQPGIADVRVDDRDGRAGEITECEAEVNDHRWHRDAVVTRHEPDHAKTLAVDPARDPCARRLHVTHPRTIKAHPDRSEHRIVRFGSGGIRHDQRSLPSAFPTR